MSAARPVRQSETRTEQVRPSETKLARVKPGTSSETSETRMCDRVKPCETSVAQVLLNRVLKDSSQSEFEDRVLQDNSARPTPLTKSCEKFYPKYWNVALGALVWNL